MTKNLQELIVEFSSKGLSNVQTAFQRLRQRATEFNSKLEENSKKLDKTLTKVAASATKAQAKIVALTGAAKTYGTTAATIGGVAVGGAAAAGAGLYAFTRGGLDSVAESKKFADQVGMDFDQYQNLQRLAVETGMEVDGLNGFLINLADRAFDASNGAESMAAQLADVGVSAVDSSGKLKPMLQLVLEMADAVAAMPDGTRKTGVLSILAGDDGARMIPLLNRGSAGILQNLQKLRREGGLFDDADATAAKDATVAFDSLGDQLSKIRSEISLIFAPDMQAGAERLRADLIANRAEITALASAGWEKLLRYLLDFKRIIFGEDAAIETPWLKAFVQGIKDLFAIFTGDATRPMSSPAMQKFKEDFEKFAGFVEDVAARISKALGMEGDDAVTGEQLALGAALFYLAGGFEKVNTIAQTTSALLTSIAATALLLSTRFAAAASPVVAFASAAVVAYKAAERMYESLVRLGVLGRYSDEQLAADLRVIGGRAEEISKSQGERAGAAYLAAYLHALERNGVDPERLRGAKERVINSGYVYDNPDDMRNFEVASKLLERDLFAYGARFENGRLVLPLEFEGFAGRTSPLDGTVSDLEAEIISLEDRLKEATADGLAQGLQNADVSGLRDRVSQLWNENRARLEARLFAAGATASRSAGGYVTGPGSSTSDSVLARLSNGEFVMRAAAVKRLGVGLLESLNAGRLPGFAIGGLVGAMPMPVVAPSRARVGSGGERPVNIAWPDGSKTALRGDADAVAAIERKARRSATAAAVRKPGWYK